MLKNGGKGEGLGRKRGRRGGGVWVGKREVGRIGKLQK